MLPEHGTGRRAGGLGAVRRQQVSRNYHLRGRILQVPSNITRRRGNTAVSGTGRLNRHTQQHGLVSVGYADPSALRHGERLGAADVDKWALYVIGQNCTSRCRMALVARSRASPVTLTDHTAQGVGCAQ